MPAPILWHIHLPRTGGIALWDALHVALDGAVLRVDDASPDLDAICRAIEEDPDLRAVSAHGPRRRFLRRIAGRDVIYVVVLREPEEQVRSWVRFVTANRDRMKTEVREELGLPTTVGQPNAEWIDRMVDGFTAPVAGTCKGLWILPTGFFGHQVDTYDSGLSLVERVHQQTAAEKAVSSTATDLSKLDIAGTSAGLAMVLDRIHQKTGIAAHDPRIVNATRDPAVAEAVAEHEGLRDFLKSGIDADRYVFQEVRAW